MGSQKKMSEFYQLQDARPTGGTCRERITQLLDPESFVELGSQLVSQGPAYRAERAKQAGDGVVAGYGQVNGRLVYLAAQDPDVYGGSIGVTHARKIASVVMSAVEAGVPVILMLDSGGVRIEEGLAVMDGLAGLLVAIDQASGMVPLIAAVYGPCAGTAAIVAAACDLVLVSSAGGGVFLNGPMVIAATENKALSPAEIGGADVLAGKTGLAAATATDGASLGQLLRQLLDYLPDSCDGFSDFAPGADDANRTDVSLDQLAERLDDGYDQHQIIASVFDQGSFFELYAAYEPALTTGLAFLDGQTVGVIAQSGARMNARSLEKSARLAELCDRLNLPLVVFADSEGYEISLAAEQSGLVQSASTALRIFMNLSVPRISVIVGKSAGSAYLTFASRNLGADLVYAWPTAVIGALPAEAASLLLYREEIADAADPIRARREAANRYANEIASVRNAAAEGKVDEIILPSATRPRLISALDMLGR